jgi:hypothetical protein
MAKAKAAKYGRQRRATEGWCCGASLVERARASRPFIALSLTTALLQWRLMEMERSAAAAAANKSKPENKKNLSAKQQNDMLLLAQSHVNLIPISSFRPIF